MRAPTGDAMAHYTVRRMWRQAKRDNHFEEREADAEGRPLHDGDTVWGYKLPQDSLYVKTIVMTWAAGSTCRCR